jgi:hypothetical protein
MCIQSLISLQNYRWEGSRGVIEEDMLDIDEDENSPKVSLAQSHALNKLVRKMSQKVLVQEEEVQPPIVCYTPPHLRRKGTICNSLGGKPMISFEAIIGKMEPSTLKLKGSIKGKNITILVDSGSTHNFVDINLTRQLNIFVYLVRDLMVTTVDGQQVKGVG